MMYFLISAALVAGQLSPGAATDLRKKRRDVRVLVADLDLGTNQGVATLDRRLAHAVLKACGTAHHLDREGLDDVDRCRADARQQASAVRKAILSSVVLTAGVSR